VISTSADEPMPASRMPIARPSQGTGAAQPAPPAPPKSPCPHPHKCAGARGASR
jgi:hypothetical protein